MTIPEPAFWSILVLAILSLIGLASKVLGNGNSIKQLESGKQDETHCLKIHGALNVEIMAMSKDIEALTRKAGIEPQPSPARNGGERKAD